MKFFLIIISVTFFIACEKKEAIKNGENFMFIKSLQDDKLFVFTKDTYKNDVLDGEQLTFFNPYYLTLKENYNNGKLEGQRIHCHSNGNISVIENYKDGKKEGVEYWFTEYEKKLRRIVHFKNNKLDGKEISYNDYGELVSKKNYKLGKQHGEESYYYSNGNIRSKTIYKDGKPIFNIEYNEKSEILK